MNKLELESIDNIIFDLGMVVINLNMEATTNAFKSLLGQDYDQVFGQLNSISHFEKYETGQISTEEFIRVISDHASTDILNEVPTAWNAMLGDIPDSRFAILKEAMKRHKTFCLSNTNELHINWIYDYLQREKGMLDLDHYFHEVYLSHEIGMRKPNIDIYEHVIHENALDPKRTVFIDDTYGHLVGAQKCGLNTFHLTEGDQLEDLFQEYSS